MDLGKITDQTEIEFTFEDGVYSFSDEDFEIVTDEYTIFCNLSINKTVLNVLKGGYDTPDSEECSEPRIEISNIEIFDEGDNLTIFNESEVEKFILNNISYE